MSATATMVAVHKPAPTQMVHSSAAVDLGLDWTVTEELATVSVIVQLLKGSIIIVYLEVKLTSLETRKVL